jgi:hypothetical protein
MLLAVCFILAFANTVYFQTSFKSGTIDKKATIEETLNMSLAWLPGLIGKRETGSQESEIHRAKEVYSSGNEAAKMQLSEDPKEDGEDKIIIKNDC